MRERPHHRTLRGINPGLREPGTKARTQNVFRGSRVSLVSGGGIGGALPPPREVTSLLTRVHLSGTRHRSLSSRIHAERARETELYRYELERTTSTQSTRFVRVSGGCTNVSELRPLLAHQLNVFEVVVNRRRIQRRRVFSRRECFENVVVEVALRLADDEGSAEEGARAGVPTRAAAVKAARAQSRDPRCDVADIGALSSSGALRESAGALAGRSLIELDLSQRAHAPLRGLAAGIGEGRETTLLSLISLSLYYNRIVYLEEVKHLVTLRKLQRLDLRLNPLTRDEAYRSYVVFHIPSLQELDERSVRPAERRHAKHTVDAMNRLELKNKDGAYGVGGMGDNEEDEERLEEDAFRK